MKKTVLLLIAVLIYLFTAAQQNQVKSELRNCNLTNVEGSKHNPSNIGVNRSPGDVIWEENFTSGFPAGWTSVDDAGIGGWIYIDSDTMYTGAYTEPNIVLNSSPMGYMHLPADYYNTVIGSWPRVMIADPVDIDATMETDWIDISAASGMLILKYATNFRLCCSSEDTKLDINVSTDGTNWITLNGRNINQYEVPINEFAAVSTAYPEFFLDDDILNGANQIKIQFRMHGGSHYFWSVDDIQLIDPSLNKTIISKVYSADTLYTSSSLGFPEYNSNYTCVPGNIITSMTLGALVHQQGVNVENLRVDFDASIEGGSSVWSASSNIVPNFAGGSLDTVLISPSNNKLHLYNTSITEDVNYIFTSSVVSDNENFAVENVTQTYAFTQTVGRYSYHRKASCGSDSDGDVGPFSYVGQNGQVGDVYANMFDMYQEAGDEFKIFGLRLYIPSASSQNVTFDVSDNGVTFSPVIFWFDESFDNGDGTFGDYVKLEAVSGEAHTLNIDEAGQFLYLSFDDSEVEDFTFPQGKYLIGIEIDNYNSEKIAIGVDKTMRQGNSHFRMKLGDASDPDAWYYYSPGGSVMIDAYTNLQEIQNDITACENFPIADFSVDNNIIEFGGTVNFTDLTTHNPTSWYWEFEGGTPSSSTEQNPSITYNTNGVYQVSLTVSNSYGTHQEIKYAFIEVGTQLEITVNTTNTNCGNYNGEATVTITGGSGDYDILWSNGDVGLSATNLEAGTHSVQVTDNVYGVMENRFFVISDNNLDLNITHNNVSCFGASDGSASVSILGGEAPYQVTWSTCENTETITNLPHGFYSVVVIDANNCYTQDSVGINTPSQISTEFNKTSASCGTNDGSLTALASGGTAPYTYLWSNGGTNDENLNLSADIYSLTVNDINGCGNTFVVGLNNVDTLVVLVDSIHQAVCGSTGSVYISVNGGSGSYTYLWSNGETSQDLDGFPAGEYWVKVSDGTCQTIFKTEIQAELPLTQEICIVTVDTITETDLVVWEKIQDTGVDHYNIYRESFWGYGYNLIGSVPFADMSEYSTPDVCLFNQSWRYKLTAVDACGNESVLSPEHKTIHLDINVETADALNLIWDDYIGFDYSEFSINRYTPEEGWAVLATVPSTTHTYIDNTYGAYEGLQYSISVEAPAPCVPSSENKSNGGPYLTSSSNIQNDSDILTNLSERDGLSVSLYPNPNDGNFTINLNKSVSGDVEILDVSGKILISKSFRGSKWVNSDKLDKGVYIVKLSIENKELIIKKVIIE